MPIDIEVAVGTPDVGLMVTVRRSPATSDRELEKATEHVWAALLMVQEPTEDPPFLAKLNVHVRVALPGAFCR